MKANYGDGLGYGIYCPALTNITDPGVQNRDTMFTSFPSVTNPAQFPSVVDSARQSASGKLPTFSKFSSPNLSDFLHKVSTLQSEAWSCLELLNILNRPSKFLSRTWPIPLTFPIVK